MINILKKNTFSVAIASGTLVLGIVAVFTAVRLYQLGNQKVAPNSPASNPSAYQSTACQPLTFSLIAAAGSPTPTPVATRTSKPSATPKATVRPTVTPTPSPAGFIAGGGLVPTTPSPTPFKTVAPIATATPVSTVKPTPVATTSATLPQAGTVWPTILSIVIAAGFVLGAILLMVV